MTERQHPRPRIGRSHDSGGTGGQLSPLRNGRADIELNGSAEEGRSLREPVPVGPQPRSLRLRLSNRRDTVTCELCQALGRGRTISLEQQVDGRRLGQGRGETDALGQYVEPGLREILR